ncbi:MAG TPA: hypothetical protein VK507_12515, partial [Iamia sp.]|nr:hypothetical protein [Iamia sp.]
MTRRRVVRVVLVAALVLASAAVAMPASAATTVTTAAELGAAFADPTVAEIVLGADITVDCTSQPSRPAGAVLLDVDGAGFTLADDCSDPDRSIALLAPVDLHDIALVSAPVTGEWIEARGIAVGVADAQVTVRGAASALVIGGGSWVHDTTFRLLGEGAAINGQEGDDAGPLVVERTTITGPGVGIISGPPDGTIVRDTRIDVAYDGIAGNAFVTVERTSIRSGIRAIAFAQGGLVTDSTLVGDPRRIPSPEAEFSGGVVTVYAGATTIQHSTVIALGQPDDPQHPVLEFPVAPTPPLTLHATAVQATGIDLCYEASDVTSTGSTVVSDDTCGLDPATAAVLPDVGLAEYDEATGTAPPVA